MPERDARENGVVERGVDVARDDLGLVLEGPADVSFVVVPLVNASRARLGDDEGCFWELASHPRRHRGPVRRRCGQVALGRVPPWEEKETRFGYGLTQTTTKTGKTLALTGVGVEGDEGGVLEALVTTLVVGGPGDEARGVELSEPGRARCVARARVRVRGRPLVEEAPCVSREDAVAYVAHKTRPKKKTHRS